jgi:hypothetical protein
MKKHNGMRPHDVAVLVKIIALGHSRWKMKDLAESLFLSPSEISESINRSIQGQLISTDKKSIYKLALLDFLNFGLKHVFPAQLGTVVQGMPTAISATPLANFFFADIPYVWPFEKGSTKGISIAPLYNNLPKACLSDDRFHELMNLIEALRIGKARERNLALELLRDCFNENKTSVIAQPTL